jgi:hypothetical protein
MQLTSVFKFTLLGSIAAFSPLPKAFFQTNSVNQNKSLRRHLVPSTGNVTDPITGQNDRITYTSDNQFNRIQDYIEQIEGGNDKLSEKCLKSIQSVSQSHDTPITLPSLQYVADHKIDFETPIRSGIFCACPHDSPFSSQAEGSDHAVTIVDYEKDVFLKDTLNAFKTACAGKDTQKQFYLLIKYASEFYGDYYENISLSQKRPSKPLYLSDFTGNYRALCLEYALITKCLGDQLDDVKCNIIVGYLDQRLHAWNEVFLKFDNKTSSYLMLDILNQNVCEIAKSKDGVWNKVDIEDEYAEMLSRYSSDVNRRDDAKRLSNQIYDIMTIFLDSDKNRFYSQVEFNKISAEFEQAQSELNMIRYSKLY